MRFTPLLLLSIALMASRLVASESLKRQKEPNEEIDRRMLGHYRRSRDWRMNMKMMRMMSPKRRMKKYAPQRGQVTNAGWWHPNSLYQQRTFEDMDRFTLHAYHGVAKTIVGADYREVGTMFVYNQHLFADKALKTTFGDQASTYTTGTCTRFQKLEYFDNENRILGGGLCKFVITVSMHGKYGTFVAEGEVFDVIPSTLSVIGGTGDFAGCHGEVTLTPRYTRGVDVFTEVSHVKLDAELRIKKE